MRMATKLADLLSRGPSPLTQRDRIIFVSLTLVLFVVIFRPALVYMSQWRGDQYWMTGDREGGIRSYKKALLLDPGNLRIHEDLGYVYQQTEKLDYSIRHYEEALKVEPNKAENHFYLGMSLFKKGDLKTAIPHFKRAIDLDPQLRLSYFSLAKSYEKANQPEKSIAVYRLMQKRFPKMEGLDERIRRLEQLKNSRTES